MEVQTALVDAADRWQSHLQEVERGLAVADTRHGSLRRAIATYALSGRLAAQDPEDEPAAELIARLAPDRTVSPPRRGRISKATPPHSVAPIEYVQEEITL